MIKMVAKRVLPVAAAVAAGSWVYLKVAGGTKKR
jgi:hypothetical protein